MAHPAVHLDRRRRRARPRSEAHRHRRRALCDQDTVDTHKDQHVAVALDGLGGTLGKFALAANPVGYAELLAWADDLGAVAVFGVEGTGSYGSGLARFLRRHGRKVVEVSRPARKGERRLSGKSDIIDAEHAAREVLAGKATADEVRCYLA